VNERHLLRIAAVAALTGAAAQLVASVLEVDSSGDVENAVRLVADSRFWNGDRLLDLVGAFLTVGALTVIGRTFAEGRGQGWARAGQPFLVLMGALGASAVVAGATMKHLADAWAHAAPHTRPAYLAVFDASREASDDLFFAAFMALGLYLAALAAAILIGQLYPRWLGWTAGASAVLVLAGELVELVVDAAFVAVLAGFALFLAVVVSLGVVTWRHAAAVSGPGEAHGVPGREPGAMLITTDAP
jgi:hypothetical protein